MEEFSRRDTSLTTTREVWPAVWVAAGVIGGPALLTMASLYFFYFIGVTETEVLRAVLYTAAFVSYVVLLPLAAGLAARNRERRREIAGEMMAFFSSRVTALYALLRENPALSEDPRTAEVFQAYSRADREMEENIHNPLLARQTIEHGVFLADELLSVHAAED